MKSLNVGVFKFISSTQLEQDGLLPINIIDDYYDFLVKYKTVVEIVHGNESNVYRINIYSTTDSALKISKMFNESMDNTISDKVVNLIQEYYLLYNTNKSKYNYL